VSTALEQLDQALTALARWQLEHEAKTAEGARVRSMTDLDITEDPAEASVRAAEAVLRLATEADVAANAVVAAELAVDEARRSVLRERAAGLRARAGVLRDAAAGWQVQIDGLLDRIAEIEGARYESPSVAARVIALGGMGVGNRNWAVPRTELAARAIDGLEKAAGELEQQAATATRPQLEYHVRRQAPAPLPIEGTLGGEQLESASVEPVAVGV
jgi:hypothetical protein